MLGTVGAAVAICLSAALIGQAVLHLFGSRRWTWLAPAVGVSVAMLCAVPAGHLPGRATTTAALLTLATAAGLVAAVRRPSQRPPVAGLLAVLPVFALTLVPFVANGHSGTLGVSFNNDMAFHLSQADAHRSEAVERTDPFRKSDQSILSSYPVGAPALVATVAQGLGIRTYEAFAGLTMATPVLLAWTALAGLRKARWYGQAVVATLAGMPFLVAAYYGQGAFKEVLQATLVLATAILLERLAEWDGKLRWAPAALLMAGILSIYSFPGLAWPLAFLGFFVIGLGTVSLARGTALRALASLRAEAAPVAIAVALLVLVLLPQIPRLGRFLSAAAKTNATGIAKSDIGNLVGPLSPWQAFGVWDNSDFRMPPIDPVSNGMWAAALLALVVLGTIWSLREGNWVMPAAAVASLAIWLLSDVTQSPYVAAKALVIASPLLMLVAARPLAEFGIRRPDQSPWVGMALVALMVVLVVKIGGSSFRTLQYANVGPISHLDELRTIKPLLEGRPTLFLGNDDFIRSELAGTPVDAPVIGNLLIPTRPEKQWIYGHPLDLDSLDTSTLNRYDWIITPRDAAGSTPPEELRPVKFTQSFVLWRRTATIQPRRVLAEGPNAAAVLDCSTPAGSGIQRAGGVAAVRQPTVSAAVPPIEPGTVQEVRLALGAGSWELQAAYTSKLEIQVKAPALRATLPANLDRPGTRWRIGRIRLAAPATVPVRIRVEKPRLAPDQAIALEALLATPAIPPRVVDIREACGQLVDWYRPGTPEGQPVSPTAGR